MTENLLKSTRQLPCSVVLLSVGTGESQDAMTATAMFVAENIPLVTTSIAKDTTCHGIIEETGEFALNVASVDQVELARKLGATHGSDVDKFKKFEIEVEKGSKIGAPLIAGSYATLECKVITSFPAAKYTVYLAEVVAYAENNALAPVAWCQDKYFALDKEVR